MSRLTWLRGMTWLFAQVRELVRGVLAGEAQGGMLTADKKRCVQPLQTHHVAR